MALYHDIFQSENMFKALSTLNIGGFAISLKRMARQYHHHKLMHMWWTEMIYRPWISSGEWSGKNSQDHVQRQHKFSLTPQWTCVIGQRREIMPVRLTVSSKMFIVAKIQRLLCIHSWCVHLLQSTNLRLIWQRSDPSEQVMDHAGSPNPSSPCSINQEFPKSFSHGVFALSVSYGRSEW